MYDYYKNRCILNKKLFIKYLTINLNIMYISSYAKSIYNYKNISLNGPLFFILFSLILKTSFGLDMQSHAKLGDNLLEIDNNNEKDDSILPKIAKNKEYYNNYFSEKSSELMYDLNPAENNLFSIKIKVGYPAQILNLLIDIGSEFTFLKIPKCLNTSCSESFEKNENNISNYDPNYSKFKKEVKKKSVLLYNDMKYQADIVSDIFSFNFSRKIEGEEDEENEEVNVILEDFHFFLISENININADGVLGLNPFISSSKYSSYSFIEYLTVKNYISQAIFGLEYFDKYHSKLHLGINNFEKKANFALDGLNMRLNYFDSSVDKNTNSRAFQAAIKEEITENQMSQNKNYMENYKATALQLYDNNRNFDSNKNYIITSCKVTPIGDNQSSILSLELNKNNKNYRHSKNENFSWNCKASHLLLGEDNNFYSAISLQNIPLEGSNEQSSQGNSAEALKVEISNQVIIEFSTRFKNLIVDVNYLRLFYEQYTKKITPFCIIKHDNKISYIYCEKKFLDSLVIPSLNIVFNGISYKISSKDLFEQIYDDSDKMYYRLRIFFMETPQKKWFFGYIFLRNNLVEFNKQKSSVIFYEGLKYDLSKFTSDYKESICFYNILNYFSVIALITFCMFYVYQKHIKKNEIIDIPFLKKTYNDHSSSERSFDMKDKKDSLISIKEKDKASNMEKDYYSSSGNEANSKSRVNSYLYNANDLNQNNGNSIFDKIKNAKKQYSKKDDLVTITEEISDKNLASKTGNLNVNECLYHLDCKNFEKEENK